MHEKIGEVNASRIITFLRSHVFKHEQYFACYKYNSYRSFGDYSNTPLEGTNGGLKYCYFAVKPNMTLTKSCTQMFRQDERKHQEKIRSGFSNLSKVKLYALKDDSFDSSRLVPKVHGQFKEEYERSVNYCSLRTNEHEWTVRVVEKPFEGENKYLIPIFKRYRLVHRCGNKILHCNCPFTTMYGIPCRHVIHVLSNYATSSYHFNHHDFDVRWWTTYAMFVALRDPTDLDLTESTIRSELLTLRSEHQVKIGVTANIRCCTIEEYVGGNNNQTTLSEETRSRLFPKNIRSYPINYTRDEVQSAMAQFSEGYNGIQKSYVLSYDNDGESDDESRFHHSTCDQDGPQVDLVDYASRNQPRNDRIDHYHEMLSMSKQLWSMLENCDDSFYNEVKKETESMLSDQVRRAHAHILNKCPAKAINQTKGQLVSSRPVVTKNCSSRHEKQRREYPSKKQRTQYSSVAVASYNHTNE